MSLTNAIILFTVLNIGTDLFFDKFLPGKNKNRFPSQTITWEFGMLFGIWAAYNLIGK